MQASIITENIAILFANDKGILYFQWNLITVTN